ncbi:MAG: hypothetical protein JWO82_368, partial [Akkermansiaceae bacterium]|nr:hypothetical protein [Akkermansiaceae bacterium]
MPGCAGFFVFLRRGWSWLLWQRRGRWKLEPENAGELAGFGVGVAGEAAGVLRAADESGVDAQCFGRI